MAAKMKSVLLFSMCIRMITSASVNVSFNSLWGGGRGGFAELRDIESFLDFNEYIMSIKDEFAVDPNDLSYRRRLSEISVLTLYNTKTEKIPSLLFKSFPCLRRLNAGYAKIQDLNRDDLMFAGNLTTLNLYVNQIKELENMLFLHPQALEEINLSHNEICWIHANVFEGISKHLTTINLSYNKLVTIREDSLQMIFALPRINRLELHSNKLIEIVPSNRTYETPNSTIFFNLRSNQLSGVKFLNIKVNELLLDNNIISTLTLQGFVENLEVEKNKLKELFIKSETITVKADDNEINAVKCENDPKLETLSMSGNKIGNKVLQELKKATKLKNLDLSNTSLESVGVDSFSSFEELFVLKLERNLLGSIEYGLFSHQKHLKALNISYNYIGSIDLHTLSSMRALLSLDISGNQLATLEDHEHIRQILPNLEILGIEANNWNCNYLSKLRISLQRQNITVMPLARTIKNSSNVLGIACITEPARVEFKFRTIPFIALTVNATIIAILCIFKFKSIFNLKSKHQETTKSKEDSHSMNTLDGFDAAFL